MSEYGYRDTDGRFASRPQAAPYDRSVYPPSGYGADSYPADSARYAMSPQQVGYPLAGYPAGVAPYPHLRPEHPQGTAVLLLGLVGLIFAPAAFVAWFLGSRAQREIEDCGLDYANSGSITAGRVLGMVVSIAYIVGFGALVVLPMVFGVFAMGSAAP